MESSRRILILKSDRTGFEQFFIRRMQTDGVKVMPVYRVRKGLFWYLAVICLQVLRLPAGPLFYGHWYRERERFDTIIVFDRVLSWRILTDIRKRFPGSRCLVWMWNPAAVLEDRQIPPEKPEAYEIWSFDGGDCARFGWRKNEQFFFDSLPELRTDVPSENKSAGPDPAGGSRTSVSGIRWDAVFLGYDKGRYLQLREMEAVLRRAGLRTCFRIAADRTSPKDGSFAEPVPYEAYLRDVRDAACVVDVPQAGQRGITLRVLEALYSGRKLITTDESVRETDFCREENILIWEKDTDEEALLRFFNRPAVPVPEDILRKYSYQAWLERFFAE